MKKVQNTRQLVATLLALLIFLQPIAAIAAVHTTKSIPTPRYSNTDALPYQPAAEAPVAPQSSSFGVELTALNTAFTNHTGIDYHQRTRKVVVSANSNTGQPNNFELIQADGAHANFSNVSGVNGELKNRYCARRRFRHQSRRLQTGRFVYQHGCARRSRTYRERRRQRAEPLGHTHR